MRTYRFGRLLGVPLLVHPSLALTCAPIGLWMSGAERYVAGHPGHSESLALGFIGALIYCASIVLHESGHLLALRYFGIRVESLTVNGWGGRLRGPGSVPRPEVDAAVAAAGPAVTLLLVAIGGLTIVCLGHHGGALTKGIAFAVAALNLAILPGCIIPVWPTDTARIVRAIAWKACGNAGVAARIEGCLSVLVTALLIESGVLGLIGPSGIRPTSAGISLIGLGAIFLLQGRGALALLRTPMVLMPAQAAE